MSSAPRWDGSGVWEARVRRRAGRRALQVSHSRRGSGERVRQGRSVRAFAEVPPATASIVAPLDYEWGDAELDAARVPRNALDAPMSIYEVHLGSWRRPRDGTMASAIATSPQPLADYVNELGFTHVELMPITEHPFYGSWGYQTTGYFAPTARYGTPQDFMFLVDTLHQHGIGVILDWVPSHFPDDRARAGALRRHASVRARRSAPGIPSGVEQPASSTTAATRCARSCCHRPLFWLDALSHRWRCGWMRWRRCCISTTRGSPGEWMPNAHGGRENLEAIAVSARAERVGVPRASRRADDRRGVDRLAEVSRPVDAGGLGFGLKWNMGWMHDTLEYMRHDPIHRRHHHDRLTFSPGLRVQRELRAAAVARRSRVRQGLAARARCRATTGRSSPTCGCCSATCGRIRARSCSSWAASSAQRARVDARGRARLALS